MKISIYLKISDLDIPKIYEQSRIYIYIYISYIMIINLPNDIYKNLGYLSDKSRICVYIYIYIYLPNIFFKKKK